MSPVNQRRLVGAIVFSLIPLVILVWPTPYAYVQIHQNGCVQSLRKNRLTGTIGIFNQQTKQWDESKQEQATPKPSDPAGLTPRFVANVPDYQAKTAYLDTAQLHKACLLADAIVHSGPEKRFTREDFQLAERCLAYVTGVLDTLPGKVGIIGGKRYELVFRNQKVLVGNAVDSLNQYVQAHPESVNWSGAETLAIALVNDHIASWLELP